MGTRPSATSSTPRPRPRPLGPAPPRARSRPLDVAIDQGWSGPDSDRDRRGWLVLYHGVLTSCNGFVYSVLGAALLDLDEPWRVIARGSGYLLAPQEAYEQVGDVPNVVFPCAALVDTERDRLSIYYGAADTVVCLAHGRPRRCKRPCVPEPALPAVPVRGMPASRIAAVPWCVGAPASSAASLASAASGDSPSQQPSLKRQRGTATPWRHSISALQRRQRSPAGVALLSCSSPERRNGPGRAARRNATAPHGAPGNVVLEKPGEEQDDDDERDQSATDVHSASCMPLT